MSIFDKITIRISVGSVIKLIRQINKWRKDRMNIRGNKNIGNQEAMPCR